MNILYQVLPESLLGHSMKHPSMGQDNSAVQVNKNTYLCIIYIRLISAGCFYYGRCLLGLFLGEVFLFGLVVFFFFLRVIIYRNGVVQMYSNFSLQYSTPKELYSLSTSEMIKDDPFFTLTQVFL